MRRSAALLLAVWFSLLTADLPSLHACAMHGAGAHLGGHAGGTTATTSPVATDASAHGHHEAPATSAAVVALDAAPDDVDHDASDDAVEGCLCLGECCATTCSPVPTAPELAVLPAAADPHVALPEPDSAAPRAPDLRLPFANGPPGPLTA